MSKTREELEGRAVKLEWQVASFRTKANDHEREAEQLMAAAGRLRTDAMMAQTSAEYVRRQIRELDENETRTGADRQTKQQET